jgi:hypothetical protein
MNPGALSAIQRQAKIFGAVIGSGSLIGFTRWELQFLLLSTAIAFSFL